MFLYYPIIPKPSHMYWKASLFSFSLIIESLLISFPKVIKIFQFTSFITEFLLELMYKLVLH
jgi:hypothetical protein